MTPREGVTNMKLKQSQTQLNGKHARGRTRPSKFSGTEWERGKHHESRETPPKVVNDNSTKKKNKRQKKYPA